jgi:hypothetical protein
LSPSTTVSIQPADENGRAALTIVARENLGAIEVIRENDRLLVRMSGVIQEGMTIPAPAPPIRSLSVMKSGQSVTLIVDLEPGITHAIQREDSLLAIVLVRRKEGTGPPNTAELYRLLFPVPQAEASASMTVDEGTAESAPAAGLRIGPFNLRPAVTGGYVDADVAAGDPPKTLHDRYYEIQPRIGIENDAPAETTHVLFEYTPHFRYGSRFEETARTSHIANGRIDWPVSSRLEMHGNGHYAQGMLETEEVDPGREYYSVMGRFKRKEFTLSGHLELGPRYGIAAGGYQNQVDLSEKNGFFSYLTRGAHASFYYELSPRTRLSASAHVTHTPPAEYRPEAESNERSVRIMIDGDLGPLTTGSIMAGYAHRESPRAAIEGRQNSSWITSAIVSRNFTPASTLRLAANRAMFLSAYESNGFYISTSGTADLKLPLPLAVALQSGTGYHVNEYLAPSSVLGVPRRDRIYGWSLGVGRPFGRWVYVRAAYRFERRVSNVILLSNETRAFLFQIGMGYFAESKGN